MRHPILWSLLLGVPAALPAQSPVDTAPTALAEIAGVVTDPDGTPWAVGPNYKAALRPGGIDFVPALPDAPDNRVLRLRLDRIHRGDEMLHLAAAGADAPLPRWQGQDVHYDRGAIVEHYRVAPRGMELSYVFAARPAGSGDLVVRCNLAGGLLPETLADGTLRLTDRRFGGVHIGAVTGIDARGERCPGGLAVVDGQLELRLPDAFVDRAQFPLVLDPWLSTASLVPQSGGNDSFVQGVTGGGGFAPFTTFVFCRTFSQSDSDVYVVNSNSPSLLLGFANSSSLVETAPVCACTAAIWQPVVWQEGPTANGPWTLKARPFFVSQGLPLQPVTTIAAVGERASISGRRDDTGFIQALVSYVEPGVGLRVRPFTVQPPSVGAAQTVVPTANGDAIRGTPRLTNSYGTNAVAGLIYEIAPAIAPNVGTLNVLTLNLQGQTVGSANLVLANGINFDPAIAGDGNHFLAAYTRFGQLQQVRLNWSGTTLTAFPATQFDTVPGKRPSMSWCGDRYLVAWGRSTATAGDDEIVIGDYLPDGSLLRPLQTLPTVAQPNQREPSVISGWASNGNPLHAIVCWSETPAGGGSGTACTRTFVTMQGGTPVNLGGSCVGNSCTSLSPCGYTQGAFAPGNQTFQIRLQYADPSAPLALLNLSDGSQPPISCGPCNLMLPLATQVLPNTPNPNGDLIFTWPLPFNFQALGFQLEFQWVMFGTETSPCPLVPNVVAYNRVRVPFAE
ncbi:MAG: hypothetical protein MUC36_11200 [Planctomycetes bacterium]|jgi:hypothetical protein|nr:hypothetical protein [Planctomycetota bacterium]